mmetsp:Transcript_109236/g.339174  ORF Transcript_109236/g.339174 Transcript_109236/m.339174 type:complete len:97 (-) Transcript_109236:94-384(-)
MPGMPGMPPPFQPQFGLNAMGQYMSSQAAGFPPSVQAMAPMGTAPGQFGQFDASAAVGGMGSMAAIPGAPSQAPPLAAPPPYGATGAYQSPMVACG